MFPFLRFENGFQARKTNLHSLHYPVNPSDLAVDDKSLKFPWQKVLLYKKFEEVFEGLPKPVVVSCKSSTRASALVAAYKVSEKKKKKWKCFLRAERFSMNNSLPTVVIELRSSSIP
jgi:protein tyrosine phosphatase (PTP) superfamily phosphohydrolase (DUF442 family)